MNTNLYLGDNGRCTCWNHAGHSIRTTGIALDGFPAEVVSAEEAKELGFECEDCKFYARSKIMEAAV